MRFGLLSVAGACLTMIRPTAGAAQVSAEVTINVPVDLTQLSPDITKVRVACVVRSIAITNGNANREIHAIKELPTSGGAVKTTAAVVFSFTNLDNPVGKTADVVCNLDGWNQAQSVWGQFTGGQNIPAFKTNQTVSMITSSFVW